jgi:hypothetical protein
MLKGLTSGAGKDERHEGSAGKVWGPPGGSEPGQGPGRSSKASSPGCSGSVGRTSGLWAASEGTGESRRVLDSEHPTQTCTLEKRI